MVGFVGVGGCGVDFFDVAFGIGTGVLFVAETVFAVFFNPTGVGVFAGGGLAGDVAVGVSFNGLPLFAAAGFDDGGVDNGGLGFFYFEAFGGEFAVDEGEEFFEQIGLGEPVAVAAEGAVVGDVHFVEAAEEVEVDAGEDAVFEFGIGEAVPLVEQDGFEHG